MKMFYTILILFFPIACSQSPGDPKEIKVTNKQNIQMEIFNIKKFNANKDESNTYVFDREDGAKVSQFGDSINGYFEYARMPTKLFEERKGYYPEGMLKVHGLMYYNQFPKGIWKYYDPNGKTDREVDYDEPYTYGWEDFLEFCKQKKINLLDSNTIVSRNIEDGHPKWILEWQIGTAESLEITLDGKSGEIIDQKKIKLDKG